jgi:hypothetical protein
MKTKMAMSMSSSMLIQISSFMKRLQGDLKLEGLLALESRMKHSSRPIIIFGQDESAFHQYLLGFCMYYGSAGGLMSLVWTITQ